MIIKVTIDGKPDKLNTDTFTLVSNGQFMNWSIMRLVHSPQGEAVKFGNYILHALPADCGEIQSAVEEASSGDYLLDVLICFIEQELLVSNDIEGVFRVNGEAERVKMIVRLEKVPTGSTIHDAASAIKQRLKRVQEYWDDGEQDFSRNKPDYDKLKDSRVFLAIKRLCKLIMSRPESKMTVDNLAVCLAPSFFDMELVKTPGEIKEIVSILSSLIK